MKFKSGKSQSSKRVISITYLWFHAMSINCIDFQRNVLELASVSDQREFQYSVQRNLDIRQLVARLVQEVRNETACNCLMANNQHVRLPFKFNNNRFQTSHQIKVRLQINKSTSSSTVYTVRTWTTKTTIWCMNDYIHCFAMQHNLKILTVHWRVTKTATSWGNITNCD